MPIGQDDRQNLFHQSQLTKSFFDIFIFYNVLHHFLWDTMQLDASKKFAAFYFCCYFSGKKRLQSGRVVSAKSMKETSWLIAHGNYCSKLFFHIGRCIVNNIL